MERFLNARSVEQIHRVHKPEKVEPRKTCWEGKRNHFPIEYSSPAQKLEKVVGAVVAFIEHYRAQTR